MLKLFLSCEREEEEYISILKIYIFIIIIIYSLVVENYG